MSQANKLNGLCLSQVHLLREALRALELESFDTIQFTDTEREDWNYLDGQLDAIEQYLGGRAHD
jgi:hypothetical protein